MSRKLIVIILIHLSALILLSAGILSFISLIQKTHAFEVSSCAIEKNSLNSQILLLKDENNKLKLSTKEYSTADYAGWKTFENRNLLYSFMYPADAVIEDADIINVIYIKSNDLDISVIHYDSSFYHPPAGTNVRDWIIDKVTFDEEGEPIDISGINALHLITNKSPQAYASDDYYFIKGSQLYHIQILHTKDKQDWETYYKFLKSFTF